MENESIQKFDTNFPSWVYALGGLAVVGVAYQSGSKLGAYMVILVLLVMIANAYKKGVVQGSAEGQ